MWTSIKVSDKNILPSFPVLILNQKLESVCIGKLEYVTDSEGDFIWAIEPGSGDVIEEFPTHYMRIADLIKLPVE